MSNSIIILITVIGTIILPAVTFLIKCYYEQQHEKRLIINDVYRLCMDFQQKVISEYCRTMEFYQSHSLQVLNYTINTEKVEDYKTVYILKNEEKKDGTDEFLEKVMLLFNEMDLFAAMVFHYKEKYQQKFYKIQGNAFCDIINNLQFVYKLFIITNKQDYTFLIRLYELWKRT